MTQRDWLLHGLFWNTLVVLKNGFEVRPWAWDGPEWEDIING